MLKAEDQTWISHFLVVFPFSELRHSSIPQPLGAMECDRRLSLLSPKLLFVCQDLERVRNLAYMVSRREKLSRSFLKLREQILEKQLVLLADEEPANQVSLVFQRIRVGHGDQPLH